MYAQTVNDCPKWDSEEAVCGKIEKKLLFVKKISKKDWQML